MRSPPGPADEAAEPFHSRSSSRGGRHEIRKPRWTRGLAHPKLAHDLHRVVFHRDSADVLEAHRRFESRMIAMVPPDPARDLDSALANMSFAIEPGRFALVGFPDPPVGEDWALLERAPAQLVRERDETTLLVNEHALEAVLARHPRARVERDLVWIRFEAPMGWEVVGFLARVSGDLARAGVPIGTVCGFSRDHLFIASRHLPTTYSVLERLFPERAFHRDLGRATEKGDRQE
jgi:hypothetical protein